MARPMIPSDFHTHDEAQLETQAERETTLGLLRRLMDELATLFRQEMALATAEVTGALTKLTIALISIVSGGAVLFAGFLVLLISAVLGLSLVVEPWLAALIVGGVVSAIGLVLVIMGRKAIDPEDLKPRRSAASLREDKDVLTRKAS
jgi:lipopolysaccharide export LptBFGC system permease protein LptF